MSEFFFVLKCMLFTVLLVFVMQIKIGGTSLEDYSQWWLKKSSVSIYLQSVAAGGVLAVRNLTKTVKDSVSGTYDSYHQSSRQAGR